MPQGRSGISANTKDRFVLDAGQVYANLDLTALEDATASDPVADAIVSATSLGATRGGNSFTPGRTLREIAVDGKLGPVKGFKRRQTVAPTLTANLIEMTVENLTKAIAGAVASAAGLFQRVDGGEITDAAYLDNVAIITTYTGSDTPIIVGVKNALVVDAPEFSTNDEDETVISVTFAGHFAGADVSDEPWFVYHPDAGV